VDGPARLNRRSARRPRDSSFKPDKAINCARPAEGRCKSGRRQGALPGIRLGKVSCNGARDCESMPCASRLPTTELDYKVADISLADWGRKEIDIAEHEMPGLMSIRKKYGQQAAQRRARDRLAAHDHPDRGADRDPEGLGADVRWASCNIFSTQDHAAAAIAATGTPVFAWKGETLEEYWDCTLDALTFPGGKGPELVVDDGGDVTLLIHKGYELEKAPPAGSTNPPPRTRKA
jgi:hypothetical protein